MSSMSSTPRLAPPRQGRAPLDGRCEWTAPAGDAPVIFHAAGNASNGDASPLGDFIYTATASSGAAPDPVK